MKISELTQHQKEHLVWRIDHKTGIGLITACKIARGEYGDMDIVEIFVKAGKSKRSAKIHARKVETFTLGG